MNNNDEIKKRKVEDFFYKKPEDIIEDINDLYLLLDFLNKSKIEYIFRGQSNIANWVQQKQKSEFKEWKLESSLRRMLGDNGEQNNSYVLNKATDELIKFINKRQEKKMG